MDYKTKIVVGGLAVLVGIMARCFAPTPTINTADILAFAGCWLLWLGLVYEWPKPAPEGEELAEAEEAEAVDETAKSASKLEEKRRRSFLRLFKEE